jgi:outer membrane protein W
MKSILVLAALMLAVSARADNNNELQFLFGGVSPSSKISIQGTDSVGNTGLAIGGRYLHATIYPALSIGGEILSMMPGSNTSGVLITNADSTIQMKTITFMADAKLAKPDGAVRPWGLVGLGFHSTNMHLDSTPKPGFAWTDTGTRETRTVVDSTKAGVAATLQAGLDFPLSDQFTVGVAGVWYALGSTTYDATPSAKAFGLTSISGSMSNLGFLASANYRF